METSFPVFGGAAAILAFFGGIALCIWAGSRSENEKRKLAHEQETQKRELEHAERIKALELGQVLPDGEVAWAEAEGSKATVAGVVGVLVPLFVAMAATGTSAMILFQEGYYTGIRIAMLGIVWGISGFVMLITIILSLAVVLRRRAGMAGGHRPDRRWQVIEDGSASITERPPVLQPVRDEP